MALVDDDPSVRKAFRRLLRAAAIEVDTYASGQELLDALQIRPPDCLILDLHMPGISGLDLLRLIGEENPGIPVIVVTGHDEPEARTRCISAGAADYLSKPVDERVLLQAIARLVGGNAG